MKAKNENMKGNEKSTFALGATICWLIATAVGCRENTQVATPAPTNNSPLSLALLDGVVAKRLPLQLGGRTVEATVFGKDLGQSALFLSQYDLPTAATNKEACEAAINMEIDRCVANVGAEITSRKSLSDGPHPAAEVVATSSRNSTLSVRSIVRCTGKSIESLTAIAPIFQDDAHKQAIDKMFAQFNAKEAVARRLQYKPYCVTTLTASVQRLWRAVVFAVYWRL
jgi:hypothetical protein